MRPVTLTLYLGTGLRMAIVRIGEAAERAGVNIQTLRYYERVGLLAEPVRSGGGYRAYDDRAVEVVRFIKRAQQLGFSLSEVGELLRLTAGGPESCGSVRMLASAKIADLEARIAELQAIRLALQRLVVTCELPRRQRDCPILAEIEGGL